MFVVGLTGGIGSGKSTVSERFGALGINILDADVVARLLVEQGQPALAAIATHFGDEVLAADGLLNRPALRARVFADAAERRWLEQLLHPLIAEELRRGLAAADSPYVMLVSPLLLETDQMSLVNRVLVVDVPVETQIKRTMMRDENTREQVQRIISAQQSREDRLARADDVLVNSGNLGALQVAVAELHVRYLALAGMQAAQGG